MIEKIYNGFPFKPEIGCLGIASSYLIKGNINILFDTGGYGARKKIIELIDNNLINCVVISHLHFDHCSNIDLFINSNIPIYISSIEYSEYLINKNIDCDLFSYFEYIKDNLNLVLIEEKTILDNDINIIFTPGHTRGHISLEIESKKICFAGDAIKSIKDYNDIDFFGNAIDKEEYKITKQKLKETYETIYCGHDGIIQQGILINRGELYEF